MDEEERSFVFLKCAIMQPTYIPWLGYFNMIANSDLFIFLDDVKYSRGSWQQRNKLLLNGQEKYLTIPVLSKGKRDKLIKEVQTDISKNWNKKHLLTITQAYGKHPYIYEIKPMLEKIYQIENTLLCEFNIAMIEELLKLLRIETKILRSSDIPVTGRKSEYLINLCNHVGANVYLSPRGSQEYIEQEGLFDQSEIEVVYHDFIHPLYKQKNNDGFISHLSIIDVLANQGIEKTRQYIIKEKQ